VAKDARARAGAGKSGQALPAGANLDYLKKLCKQRVKALRAAGQTATLSAVQWQLAKELGFPSWPRLKAAVDAGRVADAGSQARVNAFLDAAVCPLAGDHRAGALAAAQEMLRAHPALAQENIWTAAATANVRRITELLAENPRLATAAGGPRGWLPLHYLCFSRFLKHDRKGAPRFARAAALLLDQGADPNTPWINPGDGVRESPLYGAAGIANDPALTRLLLAAGADPNDHETLYHAAEFSGEESLAVLRALFERKPRLEWISYCMGHQLDFENAAGVRAFLAGGADVNFVGERGALAGWSPLHFALLRGRSAAVVRILLRAGADVNRAGRGGMTPLALARRLGRTDIARLLEAAGARAPMTDKEAFLAACAAGDAPRARALLKKLPGIVGALPPEDHRLLTHAASAGNLRAVKLMADLGFDLEVPGDWAGTALHQAAWHGHLPLVDFLLKRGARVTALNQWVGDVLHTAIHGAAHGDHARGLDIVRRIAAHMGPLAVTDKHLAAAREEGNADIVAALEAARNAPPAWPRKSAWPDSFAILERWNDHAPAPRWVPAGLQRPTLGTQTALAHIQAANVAAQYRRIALWQPDGTVVETLERHEDSPGPAWRRVALPGKPAPAEVWSAMRAKTEGRFRIITITRLFLARPGKGRLTVRTGHVPDPDNGQYPLLAPIDAPPPAPFAAAALDPAIAALPPHRRGHKIAGWKPLMDAAFMGDAARITKLLVGGADPNIVSTTPARHRPLHRAVEHRKTRPAGAHHEEAVRALLAGGADVKARGGMDRLTALAAAAVAETRFVPILRGAFGPLDFFHACVLADDNRAAALLAKDKFLARAADENGWTALHYCTNSALFRDSAFARAALLNIARQLLAAGADPAATWLWGGEWPIPPLYGCCGRHDFPEMAELLIRAGADPCDHESVYHAVEENHTGALAVIERLTDPQKLAAECTRALVTQLHWGRIRGIPWLLAHGARVDVKSPTLNTTALEEAKKRKVNAKTLGLLRAAKS
jgi:ankyrin repeat protein